MTLEEVRGFDVSIHAPVRVRLRESSVPFNIESFNSRTREGATAESSAPVRRTSFNSRTREGATKSCVML